MSETTNFFGIFKIKSGYPITKFNHIIQTLQLTTFFISRPVFKKKKITTVRSVLRSPHVNKNAQEHFSRLIYCQEFQTKKALTKKQLIAIYQKLKQLRQVGNENHFLLQIVCLKQTFTTIF